ncbi:MAG: SpoIIIAH-like family protein [Lachnospiraceae bacterium]|nr:SpoIIIAH-like family protein [Lachnospiraceae bacterium]
MKRIVKKNQVVLTLLAVMIAVAGYLNYAGNMEKADEGQNDNAASVNVESGLTGISDEDILAENQAAGESLVDVDAFPEEDNTVMSGGDNTAVTGQGGTGTDGQSNVAVSGENTNIPGNGSETEIPSDTPGEAILTNGVSVADYVAAVQLNREQVRARNKETLLSVINNQEISEELKQSAVSMMVKMTETAELESSVEMLLSAKGFDSSVVSIDNDGVDVVVSRYALSDAERAQIEDIVERKTGMTIESIVITLMELAEE